MSEQFVKNVVEAALLAAGRPLDLVQLRELFDEFERPEPETVRAALAALQADYDGRGIEVKEVASGFRIQVREQVAAPVSRLWQERPAKYSRALLETLALVAYRQPITRGEIEDIRGVAVNPNIVKTLMERGWIRVVGHREVPGRPELLGTTREFLDYFGLRSLDDLPTLAQLRDFETLGVQLEFGAAAPRMPEAADLQQAGDRDVRATLAGADAHAEADADAHADADANAEAADADATAEARVDDAAAASQPGELLGAELGDADLADVELDAAVDARAAAAADEDEDDADGGQVRAAGLVAADDSGAAVREPRD